MYESNPAGTRACQACGKKKVATITVRDESGSLTACDDCRRPFEEAGYTTASAVELAWSKPRIAKYVWYNGAVVRGYRSKVGQDRRDVDGQLRLLESEALDKRESRKEKRAAAQRRRRAAAA